MRTLDLLQIDKEKKAGSTQPKYNTKDMGRGQKTRQKSLEDWGGGRRRGGGGKGWGRRTTHRTGIAAPIKICRQINRCPVCVCLCACLCVHVSWIVSVWDESVRASSMWVCVRVWVYITIFVSASVCLSSQAPRHAFVSIYTDACVWTSMQICAWLCVYISSSTCVFRICAYFSCLHPCMNMCCWWIFCMCVSMNVCVLISLAVIKSTSIKHGHINLGCHGGHCGDSVRQISPAMPVSVLYIRRPSGFASFSLDYYLSMDYSHYYHH